MDEASQSKSQLSRQCNLGKVAACFCGSLDPLPNCVFDRGREETSSQRENSVENCVLSQHEIVREGCNIETRTFDFQDSMESILRIQCEVHRCDCPTFRNMAGRGRVERPARAAQGGQSDDRDTEVRQEKQMCPKTECTETQ